MKDKKFVKVFDIDDWEVLTDKGYAPIKAIGQTVPYDVYNIKTDRGKSIRCADTHIFFDTEYDEVFAKDLNKDSRPDHIQTESGVELVVSVERTGECENMYDIEVGTDEHRYYVNGFLCHNSIFLCNDAVNFVKSGKNVVFITCEMSSKKVIKRMGANMLDINIDEYDKRSKDVEFIGSKLADVRRDSYVPMGRLFIKEYPTSCCTTIDVENYIKTIQETLGFKVDVVIIDYINIMSNYRNPNSEDLYTKIKQISEDLRAIAVRQECLIVSATQTNRGAFDADDISIGNIAESAGLLHTCDTMFGIIQNADMRTNDKYLLKILKIRDGEGKNTKMEMDIIYKKMRIKDACRIYKENSENAIELADIDANVGVRHIRPNEGIRPNTEENLQEVENKLW
jgi:KaiC/GvpD/RAD55 family RecA-like ATPase